MCSNGIAWTKQADLVPSDWDPFPELQNPANCYGNNTPNKKTKEDFENPQKKRFPYLNLNQTWSIQKPFNL